MVDASGRLIVSLEGGAVARLDPLTTRTEMIGHVGGRPLGMEVCRDGRVLICHAEHGLLRLDPTNGSVETLADCFGGVPLRFCSNVTLAADGTCWFTQSTDRFAFEHYVGAMIEHRGSGRLFRRDPNGQVAVVLEGLHFPNGITLTEDESALILAETDGYRLTALRPRPDGAVEIRCLVENLPGFPDNLSRSRQGRFWVAMPGPRSASLDRAGLSAPWLRKLAWRLPRAHHVAPPSTAWAMAFSESGEVVADVQAEIPGFAGATGAAETHGKLYLASISSQNLLEVDLAGLNLPPAPR